MEGVTFECYPGISDLSTISLQITDALWKKKNLRRNPAEEEAKNSPDMHENENSHY